jgi:hypothetical protein
VTVVGDADFTSEMAGEDSAGTVTFEGGESTGGPLGGVPVALAMFVMEPASTSACVTV